MNSLQGLYDDLSQFVKDEQDTMPDNEQVNYLGLVFGDIVKQVLAISIIRDRQKQSGAAYVAHSSVRLAKYRERGEGTWQVTPEEDVASSQSMQLAAQVHLDLESLFIFVTVLLDRITGATEYYFGPAQVRWKTFRTSMQKYLKSYASARGLSKVPQDFFKEIQWLCDNVVATRDLLVVHKHDKDGQIRLHLGTGWGADNETYLSAGIMYPVDTDVFPTPVTGAMVIEHLVKFGKLWLAYLEENRTHRVAHPPL